MLTAAAPLPYLTAELPGIGGALRVVDDDFVVEEVPAYAPSGVGEHVYVRIEKRGLSTSEAVRRIARGLGLRERDVGVAGLKDRHAVTTQWLSLPTPCTPEAAAGFATDGVRVLEATRHGNKLRTGHLRGNRFRLRVRRLAVPPAEALTRAQAILARLTTAPGVPNWYGEQRFGRDGDNAGRGLAIVRGEAPLRRGPDERLTRLMISALQSELFNRWLIARLADGAFASALAGDVMHKRGGGLFACEDAAVDDARVKAGEIVPTGPMFGTAMRAPAPGSPAADREQAVLAEAGLALDDFARVARIAEGTRRDGAVALADVDARLPDEPDALDVSFTLPAGAYATVVMREICKSDVGTAGDSPEASA